MSPDHILILRFGRDSFYELVTVSFVVRTGFEPVISKDLLFLREASVYLFRHLTILLVFPSRQQALKLTYAL